MGRATSGSDHRIKRGPTHRSFALSLPPAWPLSVAKEIGGVDVKRLGELVECAKGQILLRAFDGTDVGPVQAAPCGKFLLRPTAHLSQASNDGGDDKN